MGYKISVSLFVCVYAKVGIPPRRKQELNICGYKKPSRQNTLKSEKAVGILQNCTISFLS